MSNYEKHIVPIFDLLPDMIGNPVYNLPSISAIIDNVTYSVGGSSDIYTELSLKYFDYKLLYWTADNWTHTDKAELYSRLSDWITHHSFDYAFLLKAQTEEYNPIYNVEEHITDKTVHGHAITYTQTTNDQFDTTEYIYGLDSSADGDPADRTHTETSKGTHADTHSGTDTKTIDRDGNIGVVSPPDLILKEYELRRKNVFDTAVRDMVFACLFL